MNLWVLSAGILGLLTSLIHIFAGQVDPVRPFLKADLADIPKATLLACWHMVSVTLIVASGVLAYIGSFNLLNLNIVVIGISLTFITFSIVFIIVGWYFFGHRTFSKLPQWILLLPIGGLGLIGVM
ncbi:hypothetical protein FKG94_25875 [Exilibacterium tricleocarpae]|uniref:DUF423 domain-containing protein n=1 Tax=Exilibacterium tricleocarpae TaxID=2591008 RepID=A0A545SQS5_9GAMM|nr:hypothetical protein [Exilibacterium tricleocarpae]TQV67226.1 hypothetical protein FKG94_25875 [Exilibacterium tricleocarpae]